MELGRVNRIYNSDCLEEMKTFPDKSVDLILCDLPYGTTKCKWDTVIPFDALWHEYKRILKPNGNIVLFSSGLFTNRLIASNEEMYRYKLIWKKNVPTGMTSAKYHPMKYYEEICVFNYGPHAIYNPQMKPRVGKKKECYNYNHYAGKSNHIDIEKREYRYDPDFVQPSDVLEFNVVPNRNGKLHPTQKPVDLLEYLIRTYSNRDDLVLDNCIGSGSTAIACINTQRCFIGIEKDMNYYSISTNRIKEHYRMRINNKEK